MVDGEMVYSNWLNLQPSSLLTTGQFNQVYLLKGLEKDNVFLGRVNDVEYFIIINDIYPANLVYFNRYKNFKFEYFDSIEFKSRNSENTILKFLLISFSSEVIELRVLYDTLLDYSRKSASNLFFDNDLRLFLDGLSEIVEKKRMVFSEILGCWGELYFIHYLLKNNFFCIEDILNSWESPGARMLHDFKFHSKRLLFEVKTTSRVDRRIHEFMSLKQVESIDDFQGFLVSIKVNQDLENGLSCYDLQLLISDYIKNDPLLSMKFENIKLTRGSDFLDDRFFKFSNCVEDPIKFISFEHVPIPDCTRNIIDVSWTADCNDLPFVQGCGLFV